MKSLFAIVAFAFLAINANAEINPDAIIGTWQNGSGKGHVKIFKERGLYFGRIVWLKKATEENGQPRLDKKNPNKSLREKPLIGAIMLKNFTFDFDNEAWENGRVYDPGEGKEYKCVMRMKDANTLTVRGFIGFSFIGKSDEWKRVN